MSATHRPPISTPSSAKTTRTPRAFHPTDRDVRLISEVYTHRALTSDQLALLVWGDEKASTRCRHRLKLLSENEYLARHEQPVTLSEGRRPLVYLLAPRGAEMIADRRGVPASALDWSPEKNRVKWLFLEHLLFTNDIRVRLERAAPARGFSMHEWRDDATLSSASARDEITVVDAAGKAKSAYINPDGYFALTREDSPTVHRAFVEADRGTETLSTWAEKVAKYLSYFRSEAFRTRYHARKPFRVLTVTTGDARLAHMKEITERSGGKAWFWFTTYEAIRSPESILFTPVWHMAGVSGPVCFPYLPGEEHD